MKGIPALYMIEQAYIMLDINVIGLVLRGVSIIYAMTVGKALDRDCVKMEPDEDQVKASI
jgi:hypothetical protein